MGGSEMLIITPDAQIKWGQVFTTPSPLKSWLDNHTTLRDPANAIIYALRDHTGTTGNSSVYFSDNVDLSPIDQLKTLKVLNPNHDSASKAREILGSFQFKLTRSESVEHFLNSDFIRSLSDQEAQFALAYVYTLAKLRNLPVAESAGNPDGQTLPAVNDPLAIIRNNLFSHFTEYAEELQAKARKIPPIVRSNTLNVGVRLKKDWSTKAGMTQPEIDGLITRLNQGSPTAVPSV